MPSKKASKEDLKSITRSCSNLATSCLISLVQSSYSDLASCALVSAYQRYISYTPNAKGGKEEKKQVWTADLFDFSLERDHTLSIEAALSKGLLMHTSYTIFLSFSCLPGIKQLNSRCKRQLRSEATAWSGKTLSVVYVAHTRTEAISLRYSSTVPSKVSISCLDCSSINSFSFRSTSAMMVRELESCFERSELPRTVIAVVNSLIAVITSARSRFEISLLICTLGSWCSFSDLSSASIHFQWP